MNLSLLKNILMKITLTRNIGKIYEKIGKKKKEREKLLKITQRS